MPATLNNKSIGLKLANDTGSSNSDGITKNSTFNVSNTNGKDWIWRLDGGNWSSKRTGDGQITGITGDKQHRVEVAFTEDGKNPVSGTPQGFNFTLDTTVAKPTNVQSEYNNGVFKVTGQAETNSTVKVTVDDKTQTVTAGSDGKFSVDFNIAQGNADHRPTIKATVTDKAGNENSDYTATGANIPKLPVSDDKIAKARKAIADLQAAVNKAEQDGTVEHNEYDNLNTLRDAAKAAVQAVGTGDSAYQGLKNDLNSAANYVRGTTFEHAQNQMQHYYDENGIVGSRINGRNYVALDQSQAQKAVDNLNAIRHMNNLSDVSLTKNADHIKAVQLGALASVNQGVIDHNMIDPYTKKDFNWKPSEGLWATQHSVLAFEAHYGEAKYNNHINGLVSDNHGNGNMDYDLGHRGQMLDPALSNTAVGIAHGPYAHDSRFESSVLVMLTGQEAWGSNYKTPNTVEWPAEGYFPYAMMPEKILINSSNQVTGYRKGAYWSFSAEGHTFSNSVKVTVELPNGTTITPSTELLNKGYYQPTGNGYTSIGFDMDGKVSDPGNGVDTYVVHIKDGSYTYDYSIFVYNDAAAAQNHSNAQTTYLPASQNDILSGSLNEPETVITGSEQSDVAQIAELSANAAVNMNAGDDAIEIAHYLGGEINGGDGFDAVVLTGGTNALSGNHLHDVEMIDLGNAETPNVLSLTASDLLENHDVDGCLWILGQAGNRVALLDGITASDNTVEKDGELFHQYTYTTNGSTYAVMIGDDLYQNNGVVI